MCCILPFPYSPSTLMPDASADWCCLADARIKIAWTFVNISSKSPEVQGKLCGATVVFRIPLSRYRKISGTCPHCTPWLISHFIISSQNKLVILGEIYSYFHDFVHMVSHRQGQSHLCGQTTFIAYTLTALESHLNMRHH